MLGPEYLLLSSQYEKYLNQNRLRLGPIERVLVFFGSIDSARQTELAIESIIDLNQVQIIFDVIVGKGNPRSKIIRDKCSEVENIRFHCQVDNMSEFIFEADFSLGAGGATTWERALLGLPSAVTIVADNQLETTQSAEEKGIVINLGHFSAVSSETYLNTLGTMIAFPELLRRMSSDCLKLFGSPKKFHILDLIDGKNSY